MSNQPFDPAVNPISQVTGWRQQVRDAQRITALENHVSVLGSVLGSALSGDMKLQISPATANSSAATVNSAIEGTAGKFVRTAQVSLVTDAGVLHNWFSGSLAVAGSETTAGDGTADTAAETVAFSAGVATVPLEYVGTWSAGSAQVETATVVGTVTLAGDAGVVVTAAALEDSPKTYAVPVALDDDASAVATAIRQVLSADAALTAHYTVGGEAATVVLTSIAAPHKAGDSTLNIAIDNDTCTGLTAAATSVATAAGAAADTATITVTGGTILGYSVSNVTSVDTLLS